MLKLLIVIPAYNEEGSIERVVDDLIQNYPQYDSGRKPHHVRKRRQP